MISYAGPYDEIDRAYDMLDDWLQDHGIEPSGDPWEIYHDPPIGRRANWRVEIMQPCADEHQSSRTSAGDRRRVGGTDGP